MSLLVPPGLYAIGEPAADDPVVVTANYRVSYDTVRRALRGRNVWLLVLETYGINVWCAAGKGTFGTGELVRRLEAVRLAETVGHRRLLLPILGAAGVSAHEVKRRSGFAVEFATLRASDLPAFFDNGMHSTPEMRELTFTLYERLVLTPIEMVSAMKYSVPAIVVLLLLGGVRRGGFSFSGYGEPLIAYVGAVFAGSLFTPIFLPGLPTRSFAIKGAYAGFVWAMALYCFDGRHWSHFAAAAHFLLLPAISAFLALTFTGSTPFTSPSGVRKEMRLSFPVMAVAIVIGMALWIAGLFSAASGGN